MSERFRVLVASGSHWFSDLVAQIPQCIEIIQSPLRSDILKPNGRGFHAVVLDFPGTRSEVLDLWVKGDWPKRILRCQHPVLIISAGVLGDERVELQRELRNSVIDLRYREVRSKRANLTSIEFSSENGLTESELHRFLLSRMPAKDRDHLHVDVITKWLELVLGATGDAFGEPDEKQTFLSAVINGINSGLKVDLEATTDGQFLFKPANLAKCMRLACMVWAIKKSSTIKTVQDKAIWVDQCLKADWESAPFPQSDELCLVFFLSVLLGLSEPAEGLPSLPTISVDSPLDKASKRIVIKGTLHSDLVAPVVNPGDSERERWDEFDLTRVGNSFRSVAVRRSAFVSNPGEHQMQLLSESSSTANRQDDNTNENGPRI